MGGAHNFVSTTFSGNSAKEAAGGIYIAAGSLTLDNVTITNNTADSDGVSPSGDGGGIRADGVTATIRNTVIAGNVDSTATQRPDCYGTLTSGGYNHIGNMTGCTMTTTTGDVTGSSANLAALANNGGPTLTHLPNSGSAVINTGNGCTTFDQRGYGRNGTCDKGAAEFGGIAPASILTKTYYFAGSQLIAMREITTTGLAGTLYYLHQDHLGSTSLTTNSSGAEYARQGYLPYGAIYPTELYKVLTE